MRLVRSTVLASVSLISISAPAFAEDAAPTDQRGVKEAEIVVEARRRDENIQDVPLVVNAVTADTLQKNNILNFSDVAQVVPGLSLTVNANGIGTSSSMRGVNQDVNVSGDNGTIQFYLQDAPAPSNLVLQAMYDIGQIEVLRGPQGTLRGRSTPSGSITITAKEPDLTQPGGYIDGTVGSAATTNLNFGISVPVIADKLAVRVAGLYDLNRGNRVYSVNAPNVDPRNETTSIRAMVRFEPVNWFKAGFMYQGLKHKNSDFDQVENFTFANPLYTPPATPDYGTISLGDRKSVEFYPRNNEQDLEYYNWNAEADFAGQSLIYVGSRTITDYKAVTPGDVGGQFPSLFIAQNAMTHATATTHEVRLQNQDRIAGLFDYVVGYFHLTQTSVTNLTNPTVVDLFTTIDLGFPYSIEIPSAYVPGGNPLVADTPIGVSPLVTKEESFFGNLTLHLGDRTELAGGLRHIKYTDTGSNLTVSGRVISPAAPQDNSTNIYNVTLRHRFTDDLMVYASTGSSWRPAIVRVVGDFNALGYSPVEARHLSADPETSKSYEIGFKSQWLDKRLLINATYYHQDFKNYPFRANTGIYYINYSYTNGAFVPGVGQFNFISPVGVKVDGVEGEINFKPSDRFSFDATVNWSKSKISSGQLACSGFPTGVVPTLTQLQALLGTEHLAECSANGIPATYLPTWSGAVSSEYNVPVSNRMNAFLRGQMSWRGSSQLDPVNPYDNVGAYALLNLFAGVRDPGGAWTLTFFAKNIANVRQVTSLGSTAATIATTNVNTSATPGVNFTPSTTYNSAYAGVTITPPRVFGVNLRIAFGSH